ncbi:ABC transporter [Streptomyces yokosukanensis]|uniref:ABC transporter n=1 Tax=Streptomyces yokosukanensis TaxID=67386 RepID=A0A117Q4W8_9ACTN|nr:ABC transporter [Streptomyces yokosukanensis]KUN08234.1 ABC transporter [Streptomyces yokosukanensis]
MRSWFARAWSGAALVVPVWRMLPWRALGAAGAVGLLPVALARVSGARPGPLETLVLVRGAVLALALGLAFLLDDPARHTTAPVPARRALRVALRAALVAPVAALWWTAVLLLAPGSGRPPVGDVTLEAATACVLAVAAATVALRHFDEPEPGRGVATTLLAGAVLAPLLLPARWALFVAPADPRWAAAHERWAWVLAGAVVVGAAQLREPLVRRPVLRSPCGTSGPSRTC